MNEQLKTKIIFGTIGLIVGVLITVIIYQFTGPKVSYITGYATTDSTKTALSLRITQNDTVEQSYTLTPVWKSLTQEWGDAFPTCVTDSTNAKRVRIGIMKGVTSDFGTRDMVVSVQCLE